VYLLSEAIHDISPRLQAHPANNVAPARKIKLLKPALY